MLNALGAIHGIAVLCDGEATAAEKTEAAVETTSGLLGVAGRLVPAISPVTAALSGSLLINFYVFKGLLGAMGQAYADLEALGLNICYADMKKTGGYISSTAMKYAAAIDLAGSFDDPGKVAELAKQTEALRWNLVDALLLPFVKRATLSYGGRNEDPGTYSVLRAKFQAIGAPTVGTPVQTIAYTKRLLETIVDCFTHAQDIYVQQVHDTWANH